MPKADRGAGLTTLARADLFLFMARRFQDIEAYGAVLEEALTPAIGSTGLGDHATKAMQSIDLSQQTAQEMARFCKALAGADGGEPIDVASAVSGLKLGAIRDDIAPAPGRKKADSEVDIF